MESSPPNIANYLIRTLLFAGFFAKSVLIFPLLGLGSFSTHSCVLHYIDIPPQIPVSHIVCIVEKKCSSNLATKFHFECNIKI